jgi:hypothetical protein
VRWRAGKGRTSLGLSLRGVEAVTDALRFERSRRSAVFLAHCLGGVALEGMIRGRGGVALREKCTCDFRFLLQWAKVVAAARRETGQRRRVT